MAAYARISLVQNDGGSMDPGSSGTDNASGEGTIDALFVEVYDRLKALASRKRHAGDTLDTTALVHELYLRVGHRAELQSIEHGQFFAYAAKAMRNLLIDRARERIGGAVGWVATTLVDGDRRLAIDSADEAIALEAALVKLEKIDARAARVVELRYFAGLSLEQTADTLALARRTVDRDWSFARAFLHAELT
ncbi:MAG: sigma-70 family RNA polymerase sigma factor [Xanthomonadales bacterium]|nr:sigma-70 family RNA polymerase sigma factor [Xanthomonadales bacterium]